MRLTFSALFKTVKFGTHKSHALANRAFVGETKIIFNCARALVRFKEVFYTSVTLASF